MHDKRLLHRNQVVRVISVHAQEHVHPLFICIENLAVDEEFIAELAFPVEAGSRFESIDRAVGLLAVFGIKTEQFIQSVAGSAENDIIGEIPHVPVIVDPLRGNFKRVYPWQLGHPIESYAGASTKNQWLL